MEPMDNLKEINEWQIETPTGWSDFDGIKKLIKNQYIEFNLSNGVKNFGCSLNHRIKMLNGKFLYANEICIGDILFGNIIIEDKKIIEEKIDLYDLIDVKKNNEFYSEGIISHNCALVKGMEDIWTSAYPSLSQGGDCIILSTPRGVDNWFYDMYQKAENKDYGYGEEPFNPIRLMWWENLERIQPPFTPLEDDPTAIGGKSNSWSRATFGSLTKKKIAQEYCVSSDAIITLRDKETGIVFDTSMEEFYKKLS